MTEYRKCFKRVIKEWKKKKERALVKKALSSSAIACLRAYGVLFPGMKIACDLIADDIIKHFIWLASDALDGARMKGETHGE